MLLKNAYAAARVFSLVDKKLFSYKDFFYKGLPYELNIFQYFLFVGQAIP